jgi:hypothetical protein
MNATLALNKIVNLLGLRFKSEKFFTTKLEDGQTEVTNNLDEELQVGQTLYVVGEATLQPAPAGTHKTREGIVITLDEESTIVKLEVTSAEAEVERNQEEVESSKVKMTEAEDEEGQLLESPTFDVGEEVYVVEEDGEKTLIADGEHEIILEDESGNENKIRIQTEDGEIVERENVEEMKKKFSRREYEAQLATIKQGISEMLNLVNNLNGKFKTEINSLKEEFESFKNAPERKPIERKSEYKEKFEDFRVSVLKELRNK